MQEENNKLIHSQFINNTSVSVPFSHLDDSTTFVSPNWIFRHLRTLKEVVYCHPETHPCFFRIQIECEQVHIYYLHLSSYAGNQIKG